MIKGDQEAGLWLVQNRMYQNEVVVLHTAGCTDDYTQTALKSDSKTTAIRADQFPMTDSKYLFIMHTMCMCYNEALIESKP
jgi:hypothetical protein